MPMIWYVAADRRWSRSSGSPNWSSRKRNLAWSRARGGVEFGARPLPGRWWCCTPGCWPAAWSRSSLAPAVHARAGLADARGRARRRRRCGGGASPRSGQQWNTRVVVVPGAPRVDRRPVPLLPHPNYVAVVVEGVALPLVHTAWITALSSRCSTPSLLRIRIRVENAARCASAATRVIDLLVAGGGPGRAGHRAVRRPGRARGRGRRAADGADRQGLRRGADAARRCAHLDRLGVDRPGGRFAASATSTGDRRVDAPFRAGPAAGCAAPRCTPRCAQAAAAAGVQLVARRRRRRSSQDADVGVRGRVPGPLPGRRRRAALPDPRGARAWPQPAAARARWGIRRHFGSRRGPTASRCTGRADAEAYVTPVGRRLRRRRDPAVARQGGFDRAPGASSPHCATGVDGHDARPGPGRGTVAAAGAQPGGRAGAAGRRRRRLRRRADRRGHGPGVRRRRTRWWTASSPTGRRLRPALARPHPALPAADRGSGGRGQSAPVRSLHRPGRDRLPRVFAAAVNQLAY